MKEMIIPDEIVMSKIFLIRGTKIMLDNDLAELYGVSTGNLNKAVKRNIDRFPSDFMFQLTKEEFENLIFQIGTSSWGGTRKLPSAFTEQGVAMLSSILHSKRAIMVNIPREFEAPIWHLKLGRPALFYYGLFRCKSPWGFYLGSKAVKGWIFRPIRDWINI